MSETNSKKPDKVRITIDGRPFSVVDGHHTAAELLGLAGLAPAGYDLTRVRKHGEVETFSDEDKVNVKEGDVFVSVDRKGPVA